jgi:hypothetical protein
MLAELVPRQARGAVEHIITTRQSSVFIHRLHSLMNDTPTYQGKAVHVVS